jgi:hypothetical protein
MYPSIHPSVPPKGLERNWMGELRTNQSVDEVLKLFQEIEADMLPR